MKISHQPSAEGTPPGEYSGAVEGVPIERPKRPEPSPEQRTVERATEILRRANAGECGIDSSTRHVIGQVVRYVDRQAVDRIGWVDDSWLELLAEASTFRERERVKPDRFPAWR